MNDGEHDGDGWDVSGEHAQREHGRLTQVGDGDEPDPRQLQQRQVRHESARELGQRPDHGATHRHKP